MTVQKMGKDVTIYANALLGGNHNNRDHARRYVEMDLLWDRKNVTALSGVMRDCAFVNKPIHLTMTQGCVQGVGME